MRKIADSRPVLCPAADALGYLQRYFAANRGVIRLEVPFNAIGLPTGLGLGLDVAVKYEPLNDPLATRAIPVSWSAHRGGPYPSFTGALDVEPDGDVRCRLKIEGAYDAPFGAAGAVFDMIAGRRIATASLAALLERLGDEIERCALAHGVQTAYPDWLTTARHT